MPAITRHLDGLRPETIRQAYARLALYYDFLFGPLLAPARSAAVRAVNALPGKDVLEVGVGTGLALPQYAPEKRITGIDMSADMLVKARLRTARLGLSNVRSLDEMDAQSTSFADGQFDIAIAMFVASVVPDPRALLGEMRRVVRPGGSLVFINHFAHSAHFARPGVATASRRIIGALTARLGWHADFRLEDIFDSADLATASRVALWPLGFFQLVAIRRTSGN